MDWIQIYMTVLLSVSLLLNAHSHGQPREPHNFWLTLIALMLCLPWYGRVYRWW